MVSQMAKDTVAKWEKEGLRPSFDDIVRLNALGLRVERGPNSADFAALPRVAFLGDLVLVEQSVRRWMWIDAARQIVQDADLIIFAYALAVNEPVKLTSRSKLEKALDEFRKENLLDFSATQISAAVDYALTGGDPEDGESPEPTEAELAAAREARELPAHIRSGAAALLAYAVGFGLDAEAVKDFTCPKLERLIAVASMLKGAAVKDGEHSRACAEYYRTADAIYERLKHERES